MNKKQKQQIQGIHDGEHKKQQRYEKQIKEALLREVRNSRVEEQFAEPQHLAQSKRALWHRACD